MKYLEMWCLIVFGFGEWFWLKVCWYDDVMLWKFWCILYYVDWWYVLFLKLKERKLIKYYDILKFVWLNVKYKICVGC